MLTNSTLNASWPHLSLDDLEAEVVDRQVQVLRTVTDAEEAEVWAGLSDDARLALQPVD